MIYRFGRFEADRRSYELRCDGAPVHVEPKVLDLLLHLAGNPDRLVTKQELFVVDGWTDFADWSRSMAEIEASLRDKDWDLFVSERAVTA